MLLGRRRAELFRPFSRSMTPSDVRSSTAISSKIGWVNCLSAPPSSPRLRCPYFGQALHFKDSVQNPAGGKTNIVETLQQQFRISAMQLDVVGGGRSRFESDGLADDVGHRLGLGLAHRLGGGGAAWLVVEEIRGPARRRARPRTGRGAE